MSPLVIGVDFDGTVVTHDYPDVDEQLRALAAEWAEALVVHAKKLRPEAFVAGKATGGKAAP